MNKKFYACCVRPSTKSMLIEEIPFAIDLASQGDQLKAGSYCLDQLGGAWIPMAFAELPEGGQSEFMQMMSDMIFGADLSS